MDGSPMQQIIRTLDDMMSRIYVAARLDTLDYLRQRSHEYFYGRAWQFTTTQADPYHEEWNAQV